MKARKVIILILIIILLGIGGYSGYQVYTIRKDYNASEQEYENLGNEFITTIEVEAPADTQKQEETQQYLNIDYDGLKARNSDYQGWIVMDGIGVNLPVMRTNNNDYYLHRTFEGEWRFAGSLFIDYRFKGLEDPYLIIYGHHMRNGSMFGLLNNYWRQSFYEEHPTFQIYLKDKLLTYEIFSFFRTDTSSQVYTYYFEDNNALVEQFNWLKSKSQIDCPVEFNTWDKMIVLSTCVHSEGPERWILAAKLSSVEELDNIVKE